VTVTIPEYAQIVGVSRNTAYEAARAGEVATIRVRGRVLVCVLPLLRKLEGQ
jgi:predicted site-specific integrase-resolvase